jgi:hypothetical protein
VFTCIYIHIYRAVVLRFFFFFVLSLCFCSLPRCALDRDFGKKRTTLSTVIHSSLLLLCERRGAFTRETHSVRQGYNRSLPLFEAVEAYSPSLFLFLLFLCV